MILHIDIDPALQTAPFHLFVASEKFMTQYVKQFRRTYKLRLITRDGGGNRTYYATEK